MRLVNLQSTYPLGIGGNADFEYSVFDISAVHNRIVVAGTCYDSGMCSNNPVFVEYFEMSPIGLRWSKQISHFTDSN